MLRVAMAFSDVLVGMSWCFLSPPAGSHFLTSDNPIHWNDPAAGPPWNAGLLSPKTVLSFPMSFELCLMGSWHRRLPLAREAPPEIVDVANRRTIQFAHEQVYASSRHEVEAALDLRDEFGRAGEPLGPRPLTLRVVEDADEWRRRGRSECCSISSRPAPGGTY